LTFTLQGMQARAHPRDIEHALGDTDGGYAVDDPSYTFNSQGVLTSGNIKNIKPTADTRFGDSDKRTNDYSFNMKWTISDRWAVSADAQYVKSTADVISMTAFTQNGTTPLGSLDFNLTGDTPRLNLNNPGQATASAYWWAAAMDHIEKNEADSWAERADVE